MMECEALAYLLAIPLKGKNKITMAFTRPYKSPIKKDIY